MCVKSDVAARQLDAIAAALARQRLRRLEQFRTDAVTAPIITHVDTFELATPPTGVLEVLEDNHLADANHFAILFGDKNVTTLAASLFDRRPVVPWSVSLFRFRRE